VPFSFGSEKLPINVQLVSKWFDEARSSVSARSSTQQSTPTISIRPCNGCRFGDAPHFGNPKYGVNLYFYSSNGSNELAVAAPESPKMLMMYAQSELANSVPSHYLDDVSDFDRTFKEQNQAGDKIINHVL
jgi:hypothetical protein